ncbi:MAG: hypothetical protein JWO82_990, partial [Akkermansiaceae bacterium]|nr:hypothetical protein [Akkermansiaceae bacterium]
MNTTSLPAPSQSSSSSSSLSPSPSAGARDGAPKPGRPSGFSNTMVDVLCSIVRTTGISDSGAAGRASLHPSTVSRWKRDFPDLAILLRTAREEFRAAQLDLILGTARSGQASGWRAAAWLLERTFPE